VRYLRLLAQGLTPVILLAGIVSAGAYALRVTIVRRAAAEEEATRLAVATTKARTGDFQVAVEAIGKLEAVESKAVVAKVSGQIVRMVPNGVEVEEGDVIIELDALSKLRELRTQERQYQDALEEFESKKRGLAAEVEKARIGLEKAGLALERTRAEHEVEIADKRSQKAHDAESLDLSTERLERSKTLAEEGLIALRDIDIGEADLKAKRFALERESKDLELAETQAESEILDRDAEVQRAEADLERAKSKEKDETENARIQLEIRKTQLERVREQFEESIIESPADGIVVLEEHWQGRGMARRPLQPGDQVWEGRTIATIPDLSKMRALLEVSEEQARQVKRKQEAEIIVDALSDRVFPGEVTEISQTAQEARLGGFMPSGERVFQTYVEMKDHEGVPLRPGMSAQVRIIVERIPDAVSVPLVCVFERDNRHVVYARDGKDFRPVGVELGEESGGEVVVIRGLEGGEVLSVREIGEGDMAASDAAAGQDDPISSDDKAALSPDGAEGADEAEAAASSEEQTTALPDDTAHSGSQD
jgi:RND family efflux transporter MFP subunit